MGVVGESLCRHLNSMNLSAAMISVSRCMYNITVPLWDAGVYLIPVRSFSEMSKRKLLKSSKRLVNN